jgi:hypothetical protein
MNILGLLIILLIVGWIYNRARRNGKESLLRIFVAVASFVAGMIISGFIVRYFLMDPLSGDNIVWLPIVAAPMTAGIIWLIYVLLKKVATPKKEIGNTPLDADIRIK